MYKALKIVLGFLLGQFFSEIRIRGAARREEGATIIVVNHPNLALDSLLVAKAFKRDLWFIAKATLFANPLLKRFFTACHMLPVKRRQDEGGEAVDNREIFSKVINKLCAGQAVVIFPEGASLGERKILPLKTGAARMAFQAEEARGFNLGLKIQAVGLTYSKLDSFKSSVTLTLSEPIDVAAYRADYERDALDAVRRLTEKIGQELKEVTVNIEKQEHVELVEKISLIYRSKPGINDDRELMQVIARNLSNMPANEFQKHEDLLEKINIYCEMASLFGVDGTFALEKQVNKTLLTLALPFLCLAYLVNIIPYRLVGRAVDRTSREPVYRATFKFGYGVFIFFSWYVVMALVSSVLFQSAALFFITFLLCLLSGFLLNRYMGHLNLFIISYFWPVSKRPIDLLLLIRDDLIRELDSVRVA